MSLFSLEISATVAALVAAGSAVWQGFLTRRAIENSYETSLLEHRLHSASESYSALERFMRLLRTHSIENISDEDLRQIFVELDNAKTATNDLSFRCKANSFGEVYSKFGDFYVWFLSKNEPKDYDHSFFEEAIHRAKTVREELFEFAQSIQRPEDRI
jgi:uncharacterized protein (DUF1697 family)